MQISQVSSNNVVVGNQPQVNPETSSKTQATETKQKSDQTLNTDRVTLSPQAQQLALQENDSDGQDVEAAEANATQRSENANNNLIPKGITKVDILA